MEKIYSVQAVELNCTGAIIVEARWGLLQSSEEAIVCGYQAELEYLGRIDGMRTYVCLLVDRNISFGY